jgi:DNA invertase Pin-like site-specific DNA recombinase
MDKPVAGYYRISVARDGMQAPEMYEDEIRRYCTYKGLTLGRIYKDLDRSGFRGSRPRPGLEELKLDMLDYSHVIVPKLARFGRSVKDLVGLFDRFDNAGVGLVFLDMNIDTSTSQGRLLRHIMAAFAEYESDVKADYARANHRMARAKGLPWGLPPFGYVPDRAAHSYTISQNDAAMVRYIFEAYAGGGSSQYRIANQLNDAGMKRAGMADWSAKQVGRILDNPAYAALCISDDGYVEGSWAAIVDRATWDRVRELRINNVHRTKMLRAAKGGPYLLSGLLYCGYCGKKLVHRSTRNRNRNGIYVCVQAGGKWCPGGSVCTGKADDFVAERFLERCRFTIEGEADSFRDSEHAWLRASIEQRRTLLRLAVKKVLVIPWDGGADPVRIPARGRGLRIEWKPGTKDSQDLVLVADRPKPGTPRRRTTDGRSELMRAQEALEIERKRQRRSEVMSVYFNEWSEVRRHMRDDAHVRIPSVLVEIVSQERGGV